MSQQTPLNRYYPQVANASTDAKNKTSADFRESAKGRSFFGGWLPERLKVHLREKFEGALSEPVVVPEDEVGKLRVAFQEEIQKLEAILGRDLSSWTCK